MSLNIKNARTVALVRELAERTGASQTSAIEQAVQRQLEELDARDGHRDRAGRLARATGVLEEIDAHLTDGERTQLTADAADTDGPARLYDPQGLFA